MIGILLMTVAEIFAEIGTSIGKYEVSHKKESLYAMGFLNAIWATIFLVLIALSSGGEFVFSLASLPTFIARAVLEVILVFVALKAVITADRSTFSFLRIITLPLLLLVDIGLGYDISLLQMVGISLVVISLIFLIMNHGLSKEGKLLSLLSAVLAVGTVSLYKHNVTHYNSVEAEQIIMHLIILLALIISARVLSKENVFASLTHRTLFLQSLASGVATVLASFAFLFAPASILMTAKRSFEVSFSMLTGRSYFKEKHMALKVGAFSLITLGIVLMVV
jgi:hypothetical protein